MQQLNIGVGSFVKNTSDDWAVYYTYNNLDNVVKAVADNLTYLGLITDDRLMRGLTASFESGVEDFVVIRLNEVRLAVKRLSI